MATINFTDYTTKVPALWLNDVDAVVWDILGGATTVAAARTALLIGGATDVELIQDTASTMIQNGGGITWTYNDGANTLTPAVDHGGVGGLTDDDHTQYAILLGRAGGQVVYGGVAASENLRLDGTSHATAGYVYTLNSNLGVGTATVDRRFHAEQDSAATNTVTYVGRFTSTSTGTPAAGIGVGIEFEVETAAGNNEIGATIEAVTTDVTSTSEDFDIVFKTMAAGGAAAHAAKLNANGLALGMDGKTNRAKLHLRGSSDHLAFQHSTGDPYVTVLDTSSEGVLNLKTRTNTFSSTQTHITFTCATSTPQVAINIPGNGSSLALNGSMGSAAGVLSVSAQLSGGATTTEVMSVGTTLPSGTPLAGYGARIDYHLNNAAGISKPAGDVTVAWIDPTNASEDSKVSFATMAGGGAKAERAYIAQGMVVGSATGGDQGSNTVNASAYYDDGVLLATNPARTWQDVTGSRALNTIYQNTTGYEIEVSVVVLWGAAGDATLEVGTASPPTILVGRSNGNTWREQLYACVPNNSYYRVASSDTTLTTWSELR